MQMVANVLDCVVAVITITIQYPHIDVIMCWCTLHVRACMQACMHARERACVKHHATNWVKLTCPRIFLKKKFVFQL